MGKKLSDIEQLIDSSGIKFYNYLHHLLNEDLMDKLEEISLITDVYLFSGIIRNYFLHVYRKRDVDVVIGGEIDVAQKFENLPIKKNSFGGYKIEFPSGPLDLWYIKDTWAFQHSQKTMPFNLEKKIPHTSFFNFSAIIFSLNKKTFYYSEDFIRFLRTKKLDYVYKHNPNYPLCIVNTFYYSDHYSLEISDRLSAFVEDLDANNLFDYESVQLKHFGEILYSNAEIKKRINEIRQ